MLRVVRVMSMFMVKIRVMIVIEVILWASDMRMALIVAICNMYCEGNVHDQENGHGKKMKKMVMVKVVVTIIVKLIATVRTMVMFKIWSRPSSW